MEYTEMHARDESQTWRLRYNNRALRWFEQKTGLTFMQMDENELGLNEITYLVAAGLQHENPEITAEDADEVIDAVGFRPAFTTVMEALQHDLGSELEDAEQTGATNGTAPKNASGTGAKRRRTEPKSA